MTVLVAVARVAMAARKVARVRTVRRRKVLLRLLSNTEKFYPSVWKPWSFDGPRLFLLESKLLLDRLEREEEVVPALHARLELELLTCEVAFHFPEATRVFLEKDV